MLSVSDAGGSTSGAGRVRLTDRGVIAVVGVGLVLAAMVGAWQATHWKGWNSDQFYYVSMALQWSGTPYSDSLVQVSDYYGYTLPAETLNYGYLQPAVAPLIYSRTTLPLVLTPLVAHGGLAWSYLPTLVSGAVVFVLLLVMAVRRYGWPALAVGPLLLLGSHLATEFAFGIYVDAFVMLQVTLLLVAMPTGRGPRRTEHVVMAAGIVAVMALTRQTGTLPILMVLGGWAASVVGERRWRTAWLPFVLAVVPTALLSYVLVARWAPFDVMPYLLQRTGSSSVLGALRVSPGMAVQATYDDLREALPIDPLLLLVVVLAVIGFVVLVRDPLGWVSAGALLSCVGTVLLNPVTSKLRYFAPAVPTTFLIACAGGAWLCRRWTGPTAGPPPGDDPRALDPPSRTRRLRVGAVAAVLATVCSVVGTVAVYQAEPLEGAASRAVTQAEYGSRWPLTVSGGTLLCAGDDAQVWFRTADGALYPFSGTAMARSFGRPPLLALRKQPSSAAWGEGAKLLADGVALCRPGSTSP